MNALTMTAEYWRCISECRCRESEQNRGHPTEKAARVFHGRSPAALLAPNLDPKYYPAGVRRRARLRQGSPLAVYVERSDIFAFFAGAKMLDSHTASRVDVGEFALVREKFDD